MPVAGGPPARVRLTGRVVDALKALPPRQAESVARAIGRIGKEDGEPFEPPDVGVGERYMAMIPDDDAAPVVLYRETDSGYLVTGLSKREAYNTYTRADEPAFFDTPTGKAILLAAAAVAFGILVGRSGKGTSSP